MIGGISGLNSYYNYYQTGGLYNAAKPAQQTQQAQNPQQAGRVWATGRTASPETPVQPVRPATAVNPNATNGLSAGLPIRQGADPVEMAVRMRIQYAEPMPAGAEAAAGALPGQKAAEGNEALENLPGQGADSVQKTMEEGECQTCKERKYQDGSDDMGVSFKTPTRIDPDQAASAVRGHEMEHVYREQAKAQREDRRVVSQNVTYHTAICPECGKSYVSGGTTRTVTAANPEQEVQQQPAGQESGQQARTPFSAVA